MDKLGLLRFPNVLDTFSSMFFDNLFAIHYTSALVLDN